MNNIRISYAITVCNEFVEIQHLLEFLLKNKRKSDEIVVLFDSKNGIAAVEDYLRSHSINGEFNWIKSEFTGDFSEWKNKLTSLCNGDYIFNIDADELPHEQLIQNLPELLNENASIDLIVVPRINIVEGITPTHIEKWGWNVDSLGRINFPDPQTRIYKNIDKIQWHNKVHERLKGFTTHAILPLSEEYCLYHLKSIERQEKQNSYYETL